MTLIWGGKVKLALISLVRNINKANAVQVNFCWRMTVNNNKLNRKLKQYRRNDCVHQNFIVKKISKSLTRIKHMTFWLPVRCFTHWATGTYAGNGSFRDSEVFSSENKKLESTWTLIFSYSYIQAEDILYN